MSHNFKYKSKHVRNYRTFVSIYRPLGERVQYAISSLENAIHRAVITII
jgi:hypothetical protein